MEENFLLIKNYVDNEYAKKEAINHETIAEDFNKKLSSIENKDFCDLLIYTGYIPDFYPNDSSEETLYSKLIEVLVANWANRMGFKGEFIKPKGSFEDVKITINNKVVVCDAKSFRLGRSQLAPNVKDFIKLEDYRKWLAKYAKKLGGLVVFPCTHEWKDGSDAYLYCSDKSMPTLMLPYKYLSYLLYYKDRYDTKDLEELWDYRRLFPNVLKKNMPGGNKTKYWDVICNEIMRVTRTSKNEFDAYKEYSKKLIRNCILVNLKAIELKEKAIALTISSEIEREHDIENLKQSYIEYRTKNETELYDVLIQRIIDFRLNRDE